MFYRYVIDMFLSSAQPRLVLLVRIEHLLYSLFPLYFTLLLSLLETRSTLFRPLFSFGI